jgi:hypothetical protein
MNGPKSYKKCKSFICFMPFLFYLSFSWAMKSLLQGMKIRDTEFFQGTITGYFIGQTLTIHEFRFCLERRHDEAHNALFFPPHTKYAFCCLRYHLVCESKYRAWIRIGTRHYQCD